MNNFSILIVKIATATLVAFSFAVSLAIATGTLA
jgi:hypothetical protein